MLNYYQMTFFFMLMIMMLIIYFPISEGDNLCQSIAEFLCSNLAVSLTLSDNGHFILCCLEGLATLSEKFPSLAKLVWDTVHYLGKVVFVLVFSALCRAVVNGWHFDNILKKLSLGSNRSQKWFLMFSKYCKKQLAFSCFSSLERQFMILFRKSALH